MDQGDLTAQQIFAQPQYRALGYDKLIKNLALAKLNGAGVRPHDPIGGGGGR
jgi:hypothetical protein